MQLHQRGNPAQFIPEWVDNKNTKRDAENTDSETKEYIGITSTKYDLLVKLFLSPQFFKAELGGQTATDHVLWNDTLNSSKSPLLNTSFGTVLFASRNAVSRPKKHLESSFSADTFEL
jgi:hypothetical protein